MDILIPGGSGMVGRALVSYLYEQGHSLTVLTHRGKIRDNLKFPKYIKVVTQSDELPRVQAIVNLAGARISTYPLTQKRINKLISSRLDMIALLKRRYGADSGSIHFLQASATGIYPDGENLSCETTPADSVYARMCAKIEERAREAFPSCALLRLGVVIGDGGLAALLKFLPNLRFMPAGNFIPYIENLDVSRAIALVLDRRLTGPVNCCSDTPLNLNQLMHLAQKHKRLWRLYLPRFLLKLDRRGALLLCNQKIIPDRLLRSGFKFTEPGF